MPELQHNVMLVAHKDGKLELERTVAIKSERKLAESRAGAS